MSEDNQDHESHPNENLVVDKPDPDPVDAEATEPAERPQSRGVTRRALLGGTAIGAGLLAYTSDYEDGGVTHSIARAATVPDEPLITVGPEDDPVGYIFESNGDWVFKHEASGNEFFYNSTDDRWETNQELDVPALVAEELDVTNETHIRMGRASDTSSQTSGTFVNAYDTELKDNRNELNASQQFVPDETGFYDVTIGVRMGVTAGDSIVGRVRDVDTPDTPAGGRSEEHAASTLEEAVFPFPALELTAGQAYELQVSDIDNSFTVNGTDLSIGMIRRSIVG